MLKAEQFYLQMSLSDKIHMKLDFTFFSTKILVIILGKYKSLL